MVKRKIIELQGEKKQVDFLSAIRIVLIKFYI